MPYENFAVLTGYLGSAPVVRFTASGIKVANVRLATNYYYKDKKTGATVSLTSWHALSFFDAQADAAATYLKGDNISVRGRLQDRSYITAENPTPRIIKEIVVLSSHLVAASRLIRSSAAVAGPPNLPSDPDASLSSDPVGLDSELATADPVFDESWPV